MLAQVAGIALDDITMASVVAARGSRLAALGSSQQPVAIDRARIDRQIRELALEYAGGLPGDAYLAQLKSLREARDVLVEASGSRHSARSNGCRPLPSQSSRQTYRRRGQT